MPSTTLPAAALGLPASRRSVLRGFATLPLVGSVATTVEATTPDPIFAAIDLHREKQAGYATMPRGISDDDLDAIMDAEGVAREALHATIPQTGAGLAAYVAYWSDFIRSDNASHNDDGMLIDRSVPGEAFPAIARAVAALFPIGGAA